MHRGRLVDEARVTCIDEGGRLVVSHFSDGECLRVGLNAGGAISSRVFDRAGARNKAPAIGTSLVNQYDEVGRT